MEQILIFFNTYGLILTLFAVAGIIVLGVLKYCNVFSRLAEKVRHVLYLVISISLSLIASLIYLIITHQFEWQAYLIFASAVYVLNQAFYTLFKVTSLNDLGKMILDFIKKLLTKKKDKQE